MHQNKPNETHETKLLHRIADATEATLAETRETQRILLVIARHLMGGMSPEEVQAAQAEARELSTGLERSKNELAAAIRSQNQPKQ